MKSWMSNHKILSAVLGVLIIIVLAAAVSGGDSVNNETQQPSASTETNSESQKTYTLTAEASAAGQSTLDVGGTTNLPDGAIIEIDVARISIWQGENQERFFDVTNTSTTVQGGSFSTEVKVDDKSFLDFELASGEAIKELNEDIEVEVYFDPKEEGQPAQVVDAVGENGELLEDSPQKSVFGSATPNPTNRLEVELRTPLSFPYQDQLPR